MEWLRWYHGAISDPKWPLVARRAGQNIGVVVSIWAALLEYASQNEDRGSVEGFDPEAIDALFGYPDGTTVTVCNAMKRQHVTDETQRIVSWEKRQVKRERKDDSTERVRRYRENKKANDASEQENVTPCNAGETPRNTKNRTEQNRTERKTYTQNFENFWKAYPARDGKKQGKKEAFAEWQRATKDVDEEFLIAQIESLAPQYGQYPVDACRWLKHRRWEDEVSAQTSQYDNQFAGVI